MITGVVSDSLDAMFQVRVIGPGGQTTTLGTVIDTGLTGYLTLPRPVIEALRLPYRGVRKAELANGPIVIVRLYRALMIWNDQDRAVQVVEAEGSPLIGMAILRGFRLIVDVKPGGRVAAEALA